jgi:hypothetical protein
MWLPRNPAISNNIEYYLAADDVGGFGPQSTIGRFRRAATRRVSQRVDSRAGGSHDAVAQRSISQDGGFISPQVAKSTGCVMKMRMGKRSGGGHGTVPQDRCMIQSNVAVARNPRGVPGTTNVRELITQSIFSTSFSFFIICSIVLLLPRRLKARRLRVVACWSPIACPSHGACTSRPSGESNWMRRQPS